MYSCNFLSTFLSFHKFPVLTPVCHFKPLSNDFESFMSCFSLVLMFFIFSWLFCSAESTLFRTKKERMKKTRPPNKKNVWSPRNLKFNFKKISFFSRKLLPVHSKIHYDHREENGPTVVWKNLSCSNDRKCSCYTFSPTEYRLNQWHFHTGQVLGEMLSVKQIQHHYSILNIRIIDFIHTFVHKNQVKYLNINWTTIYLY